MSTLNIQLLCRNSKEKSLNYYHLLPDLAPWLTLSVSNYPCLEMFEPLKSDCSYLRAQHFLQNCMCAQWRLRSACASAQSDQSSQVTLCVGKDPKRLQVYSEDSDHPADWSESALDVHAIFKEGMCPGSVSFPIILLKLTVAIPSAINSFNSSLDEHDIPCLSKQCRSRSVGLGSTLFVNKYVNLSKTRIK